MECGHFHHLPCVSQWLFPGGGGVAEGAATPPTTSCLLDVSSIALPKLNRKQKAVARWVEDGYSGYTFSQPPEVRVQRISLEQRHGPRRHPHQREPPPPPAAAPLQPPPQAPAAFRKAGRSKRRQRRNDSNDTNRLPVSVSEGRALGVQVQPLMAVLMSPRPSNECSPQNILDMDRQEETCSSPTGDNFSRKSAGPQLSVTSLELPDWSPSPHHQLASKSALPWRPSTLRSGRPPFQKAAAATLRGHSSRSLALDCSKMSLSSRLQRAAI